MHVCVSTCVCIYDSPIFSVLLLLLLFGLLFSLYLFALFYSGLLVYWFICFLKIKGRRCRAEC